MLNLKAPTKAVPHLQWTPFSSLSCVGITPQNSNKKDTGLWRRECTGTMLDVSQNTICRYPYPLLIRVEYVFEGGWRCLD